MKIHSLKILGAVLLCSVCLGWNSCIPQDYDEIIQFGPHPNQTVRLMIAHDAPDNTPVVFLLPGGGWNAVSNDPLDAEMTVLVNAVKDEGLAAAVIDYRGFGDNGCGQPTLTMDDVQGAVSYLKNHAATYNISPGDCGIAGHSSGGHLALTMGLVYAADFQIKAVLSSAGPTDLTASDFISIQFVYDLLECWTGVPYDATDPAVVGLYQFGSPVNYCSSDDPQVLLVYGTDDTIVPSTQGSALNAALTAAGVGNLFLLMPNTGHAPFHENQTTSLPSVAGTFFSNNL